MEKIGGIRKGQIWLTAYKTDDGELAITICKSYPTAAGWKKTNFFRPDFGDIKKLQEVLHEFGRIQEQYYTGENFPLGFCQVTEPRGESI